MADASHDRLHLPEPLAAILREYDSSTNDIDEDWLVLSLERALNESAELSNAERKAAFAEIAVFHFRLEDDGARGLWGSRFGPSIKATRTDGSQFIYPDISHVDQAVIEYWSQRARSAQHPYLRARYADVLWDLTKVAIGARPAVTFAWDTIDGYIECAHRFPNTMHAEGRLERALELAQTVRDAERTERVLDAIFELLYSGELSGVRAIWAFDLLYERKGLRLSDVRLKQLVEPLEFELKRICDSPNAVGIVAQQPALRLARYYKSIGKSDEVKRVIRDYGGATQRFASKAEGLVGMHWYQQAYGIYVELGMKDEAVPFQIAAKEKGQEAKRQLISQSHSMHISTEEIEAFLKEYTAGDFPTALLRIGINFVPRLADAREQLEDLKQRFPLYGMTGQSRLNEDQTTAHAGSIDADPEGRLMFLTADNLKFSSAFLQMALDRVRQKFEPTAKTIVDFLLQSPVFDPSRAQLLEEAIDAYLRDDHVKAVHVLVPQMEHILRRLLGMLGRPTNTHRRADTDVMVEVSLNHILEEEPLIKQSLGEDTVFYMRVLLCDARGLNIRNRLEHGLLGSPEFHRSLTERLLHVLLVLSFLGAPTGA